MPVPEILPIAHVPGYRTDTIGRYAGGQFLASITYAFRQEFQRRSADNWEDHKRLYVVLHRFDFEGWHVESTIWCAGTWREQQHRRNAADSVLEILTQ
ncbi:hypothetical protein [Nonomuraea jabiensis]|uniref:hypothetical protein n=1 Tax=Nonomuraea jabiensis TaxID=882448 RepID=UPI003D739CA7